MTFFIVAFSKRACFTDDTPYRSRVIQSYTSPILGNRSASWSASSTPLPISPNWPTTPSHNTPDRYAEHHLLPPPASSYPDAPFGPPPRVISAVSSLISADKLDSCRVCGCREVVKRDAKELIDLKAAGGGTSVVFAVLKEQGIVFGEFLRACFAPLEETDIARGPKQSIMNFLQGKGKFHPADLVDSIFNHKHSKTPTPGSPKPLKPLLQLPPYSIPRTSSESVPPSANEPLQGILPNRHALEPLVRARDTIMQWAVNLVRDLVEEEGLLLTNRDEFRSKTGTGFTWDKVDDISFDHLGEIVMDDAPVLWTVLTAAAIGPKRSGTSNLRPTPESTTATNVSPQPPAPQDSALPPEARVHPSDITPSTSSPSAEPKTTHTPHDRLLVCYLIF